MHFPRPPRVHTVGFLTSSRKQHLSPISSPKTLTSFEAPPAVAITRLRYLIVSAPVLGAPCPAPAPRPRGRRPSPRLCAAPGEAPDKPRTPAACPPLRRDPRTARALPRSLGAGGRLRRSVCVWGGNEAGESAARHPEATPARGLSRGRVRRGPRVRGERSRGASDVGSWAGGGGSPPFPCPQRVRGRPPRPLVAWRTRAPRTIRKTEKSAERWFSSDSRFTNHRCPFTVAAGSNARTDFAGSCCCVFRRGKVYAYRKGVVLQKSNTQPSVKRARTP